MRVFAIDPGSTRSAWAEIEEDGAIYAFDISENIKIVEMLDVYSGPLTYVIEGFESYGMPVGRETFDAVRWSGRFEQAVYPNPVVFMPRKRVKLHLCGQVRAKDVNVRAALIDRYGGPSAKRKGGPLYRVSKDVWSALAIAVTYLDTKGNADGAEPADG